MDKAMIQNTESARSANELHEKASENGIEISADETNEKFKVLHPASGELADEELDNVSGGGCGSIEINGQNYRKIDQSELHQCCDRYVCGSCGYPGGSHADGCSSGWICGHKCSTCGNLKRIADGVYACLAQPM